MTDALPLQHKETVKRIRSEAALLLSGEGVRASSDTGGCVRCRRRRAGRRMYQPEALSQQRHHRRVPGSVSPESPRRLRIVLW